MSKQCHSPSLIWLAEDWCVANHWDKWKEFIINKMADISEIDYPLTNFDIKEIYPNLPVIKYPELANYRDIHHLTNNPYYAAIILVVHTAAGEGKGVSGHWFLIWMDKKTNDVYL
jgi:hypothetical protein